MGFASPVITLEYVLEACTQVADHTKLWVRMMEI